MNTGADQARTDFAAIETDLEFIMGQLAGVPTRRDLARVALVIMFAAAVLGIVGIEAFWRYFPVCGS